MKIKYIIAIMAFVSCTSFAQELLTNATWNIGLPAGKTSDYVSDQGWRGFTIAGRRFLDEENSIGLTLGWNIFDERNEVGIDGKTNAPPHPARARGFRFRKFPVAFDEYRRAFDAVREELAAGNSYLLNLTYPTRIETDLTLEDIFHFTAARYRILVPGRFVCFSPELFVRIAGGVISSRPMKGTISAAVPGAIEKILSDPKELAEHTTIVDLIRNDLNTVATGVSVERFRYVDTLATNGCDILQVSSLITGRLPGDYRARLGETLFE